MTMSHSRHLCDACLEEEYESYRHARVHEAMDLNKRWMEQFKISTWPRWDFHPVTSRLIFSRDGEPMVAADVVVTGAVQGDRWEWAWGNPYMPVVSRERMTAVRDFGQEKKWEKLTTLFLENDEYLGWELTAISAHLLAAEGVYRCPASGAPGDFTYVMTFDTKFVQ
jgi:hypothetical protein